MAFLDESVRQDFWTTIRDAGFSKEDFELGEIEDIPTKAGLFTITGTVSVKRKSTGMSRQYSAGHLTPWLESLDADLRGHVFGAT